jgi:hypothetical protein
MGTALPRRAAGRVAAARAGAWRRVLATSLQFKNAAEASYFSHCTRSLVPADAHVVLVEVANNLFNYGSSTPIQLRASSLRKLLKAIRAVVPAAAIVFVNWLRNPGGSGDVIEYAASTYLADLVRARAVMHELSKRNLTKYPKRSVRINGPLYADQGRDLAHPTTKVSPISSPSPNPTPNPNP